MFFGLDSSDIDPPAKRSLDANAPLLRRYPSWIRTIEDTRRTRDSRVQYWLWGATFTRRARLPLSLGISAIASGRELSKEFPFDPGHDDARGENRRAHFVITANEHVMDESIHPAVRGVDPVR